MKTFIILPIEEKHFKSNMVTRYSELFFNYSENQQKFF